MHRLIENHLEEVLAGKFTANPQVTAHLKSCSECRDEVEGMRLHNELLQSWRMPATAEVEPAPGFYARVLERIEASRPISIWTLFGESFVGRNLMAASLALAALTVSFAVLGEQATPQAFLRQSASVQMDPLYPTAGFASDAMSSGDANNGAVLMSLVSYQGR